MNSPRLVRWALAIVAFVATEALAGPVKIHVEGTLTGPGGSPTYDGVYPVTVRLWNGGSTPILKVDTVQLPVVHGKFLIHVGPYDVLTRELFSTQKSLSFQFPGEDEISPRSPFLRMAPSGEIYCAPVRLSTAGLPTVDAGTRVRLGRPAPQKSAVGILLSMTGSQIELLDARTPGLINRFAFDSIDALDISTRFRRHGEVGFLSGVILGAAAGYAMGSGEEDDLSMSKETKRAFDAFAGAILGGLTGYLLGNSITTDRWQPLPLDRVRERARNGDNVLAGERR